MSVFPSQRVESVRRPSTRYRFYGWALVIIYMASVTAAVGSAYASGKVGYWLRPAVVGVGIVGLIVFDLMWSKVTIDQDGALIREIFRRTVRVPRERITQVSIRRRKSAFLGVDGLPFATLSRIKYGNRQIEEMAAHLAVPVVRTPRRWRKSAR